MNMGLIEQHQHIVSPAEFDSNARKLVSMVEQYLVDHNRRIDVIGALDRGGTPLLSYFTQTLDLQDGGDLIRIKAYDNGGQPVPVIVTKWFSPETKVKIRDEGINVLVLDEVFETKRTVFKMRSLLPKSIIAVMDGKNDDLDGIDVCSNPHCEKDIMRVYPWQFRRL
jgi:hypoxanthine phosphoribosyltransferase